MNTTFQTLRVGEIEQSSAFPPKPASGRARCRVCGERIVKGSLDIVFYHAFNGGCAWERVECHAHDACLVEAKTKGVQA